MSEYDIWIPVPEPVWIYLQGVVQSLKMHPDVKPEYRHLELVKDGNIYGITGTEESIRKLYEMMKSINWATGETMSSISSHPLLGGFDG